MAPRARPHHSKRNRSKEAKAHKGHQPQDQDGAWKQSQKFLAACHKESQSQAQASNPEFHLDEWQQQAYDVLISGENLVVDAPTTAGKTRIVETFFRTHVKTPGFRAAYTTPVKSLSNDKVREFREMFGDQNVGIATGDLKENLHAPIVVATLESYRNSLLGTEPDLGRKLVVFDEYHFVQDESRGSAWEEAIILSPHNTQLLLLSASVDNSLDFCHWIDQLKPQPCHLIQVNERPVPLTDLVFYKDHWLLASSTQWPSKDPRDPLVRFPIKHDRLAQQMAGLEQLNLTPCIVYAGQRLACENIALQLTKSLAPLDKSISQTIKDSLDETDRRFQCYQFLPRNLRQSLIVYGVGYHHSGLGPGGRIAVEVLLKSGMIRFCVATTGLSIGINFAVRSALISDYKRPGSGGPVEYDQSEVLQMLGRAGRRGRDVMGFSLWPNHQSYQKFMPAKRQKIYSQLRHDPATFLGLVSRGFTLKQIEAFYEKSFLSFKDKKADLNLIRLANLKHHLNGPIPCENPGYEYALFKSSKSDTALCQNCPQKKHCHQLISQTMTSNLAQLQVHLYQIGAIDRLGQLTSFGEIARFLPQSGGLFLAHLIDQDRINSGNLISGVELIASLTLARFKEPFIHTGYRYPFDEDYVEQQVTQFYPYQIFPEVYDPPYGRRSYEVLREFNPAAGFLVREWAKGCDYKQLIARVCHEKFAQGDFVNLIYRTSTYLQSLAQANIPGLSQEARALWFRLMREPIKPSILGKWQDDSEEAT